MAIPIHSTHTSLLRTLLFALDALRPRMMELLVRAILLLDASVWEPASLSERRASGDEPCGTARVAGLRNPAWLAVHAARQSGLSSTCRQTTCIVAACAHVRSYVYSTCRIVSRRSTQGC